MISGAVPGQIVRPNALRAYGFLGGRERTLPYDLVPVVRFRGLATFDVRQADYAIEYIKKYAKDTKPFFMDVNFMKMHNPTNAAPQFAGKSRLGDYSDSLLETR